MPRRPKASSTLFTIAWRAWEIAKPIPLLFPAPVTQATSLCYAIYPWRFPYFDSLSIFKILDSYTIILRSCQDTNTNAINIVTSHCEPEALHRPEPLRFGAPHGVQGEGGGNLTPSQPSPREGEGEGGGTSSPRGARDSSHDPSFLSLFGNRSSNSSADCAPRIMFGTYASNQKGREVDFCPFFDVPRLK
jgi:hypothetical protein